MKRRQNVEAQVQERNDKILETAHSFLEHPDRYEWLRQLLATYALDSNDGILIELRSVPDQACWVHYGTWLTGSGRFLKFVADEPYGVRALKSSGRLENPSLQDVTEQTPREEFARGSGRTFGWLALDARQKLKAGA